jgi:beta-glucanase (GH16 family)
MHRLELPSVLPAVLFLFANAACSSTENHPGTSSADATVPTGGASHSASGGAGTGSGGATAAGTGGISGSSGGSAGMNGSSGSAGRASGGAGSGGVPGDAAVDGATTVPGWTLVWSDEFNGASGSGPDAANWTFETGGTGWGNNELEYYTNRTSNAAMNGSGSLVITARAEAFMGRNYTSARMKTEGKFDHAYGRFEARIQIPKGQGIWPAFWLLGNDIGSAGWPACGEIDIMENIGKEPTIVHGTIHGPNYGPGAPFSLANKAPFSDAYHIYAIEWETAAIRFYVDGSLYETRTPADLPNGAPWEFNHPFFILLNVAVGGQWPGNPDGTTTFPQQMLVDYVRVYAPAP